MRFEVLGPVRAVHEARVLGPVSELRRQILAMLLVRANLSVSSDELAESLWGERLPERPDKSVQVHIYRLRKVLDRPDRIQSVPGGYLLEVGPGELDAVEFGTWQKDARQAVIAGDLDTAVSRLREALALWRGAAYADVDEGRIVAAEARRLAESRLIAYEELFDAELARGGARDVVPELTEMVAEFPLRERFTYQLMLALYRSGRRARALTAFRGASKRLATQLGTEPGRELRLLNDRIGAEDPELLREGVVEDAVRGVRPAATPDHSPPGQLPPVAGAFVGRDDELAALEQVASGADDAPGVVVTGMAGVGKTSLAVRYAHSVAHRFADGQLYLDLRGHATGPAVTPIEALGSMLRALGADPSRVPETVEEATAHYRTALAGRRMLVLLDNAASAQQVRPLLPGNPGCLTLVTSRDRLSGLVAMDGARRIGLGVLSSDESRTLLQRLLGRERVSADPEHATELVELCAGLPLALRIAAAHLADEEHRSLRDYVAELRQRRLASFTMDDDEHWAVGVAFDLSYERLDDDAQRMFRLLGLVPGLDFDVDAAAALTGMPATGAKALIRRLIAVNLLEEHSLGRFRFHDLVRDYARHRAETTEPQPARAEALVRLFAWYYRGKAAAAALLTISRREPPAPPLPPDVPGVTFADGAAATAWLHAEFHNIAAAVRAALRLGDAHAPWSWHLSVGLTVTMMDRGYLADVLPMVRDVADAARDSGNETALAYALTELGTVRYLAGMTVPDDLLVEALECTSRVGHPAVHGFCLNLAGVISYRRSELAVADERLTRALDVYRRSGDIGGQCLTLNNLGSVTYAKGELPRAARQWMEILELQPEASSVSTAMTNTIWAWTMLGQLDGIDELITRTEQAVAEVGDSARESLLALTRAQWHLAIGQYREARELAARAKALADEVAQPHLQCGPRNELGRCHLACGDVTAARPEFEAALDLAASVDMAELRAHAIRGLAECALVEGAPDRAYAFAEQAVDIARGADRIGEGEGLELLARAELARGRLDEAVRHAQDALRIQLATGHVLNQARAHRTLAEALLAGDDVSRRQHAADQLKEALRILEPYGSPEVGQVRRMLAASAGTQRSSP